MARSKQTRYPQELFRFPNGDMIRDSGKEITFQAQSEKAKKIAIWSIDPRFRNSKKSVVTTRMARSPTNRLVTDGAGLLHPHKASFYFRLAKKKGPASLFEA